MDLLPSTLFDQALNMAFGICFHHILFADGGLVGEEREKGYSNQIL